MKCNTATSPQPVWTDGCGRKAGTVYFDSLGHRRVVTPPAFYDDDGNLAATGTEAVAAFGAMVDAHQVRRAASRRPTRPPARARGAGRPKARSSARRSSERSGDSGEDGSEPPPAPRECEWCGESIDHLNADARYCGTKHRVYAARARDRANPDRVAVRAVENGAAGHPRPCKCSPAGQLVIEGVCFACGRARGAVSAAWAYESRELKVREVVMRSPARREPRTGDGKRRPKRVYVDESIVRRVAA